MEDKFGIKGVLDFLNHEDDDQNTPLLVCVESGSYESAKVSEMEQRINAYLWSQILIENGADVNHCNEDTMYPLHVACTVGSLEIVEVNIGRRCLISILISNYSDPDQEQGNHQQP